jgi:uncharacterized protein HemX
MRTARGLAAVVVALGLGTALGGCGKTQGDEFAEQLTKAGYTNVTVVADKDTKRNSKTKKKETKLDDYEATAKAGNCEVTVEQDKNSTSYVIESVNGTDVSLTNLDAAALKAEMAKQGVTC